MKYFSDEWYDAHKKLLEEAFTKPSNISAELVEIYENCEDGQTRWIYYRVDKGQLSDMHRGEGEDTIPKAMFRCFGEFENYMKVMRGELDPKKGIMTKKFRLEGNMMKAMGMLGVYAKVTESKKVPGLEF